MKTSIGFLSAILITTSGTILYVSNHQLRQTQQILATTTNIPEITIPTETTITNAPKPKHQKLKQTNTTKNQPIQLEQPIPVTTTTNPPQPTTTLTQPTQPTPTTIPFKTTTTIPRTTTTDDDD